MFVFFTVSEPFSQVEREESSFNRSSGISIFFSEIYEKWRRVETTIISCSKISRHYWKKSRITLSLCNQKIVDKNNERSKGGGANVDDFLEIGGSSTIFFTGAFIDNRRFFCLNVVDEFDFYPKDQIETVIKQWESVTVPVQAKIKKL